MSLRPLGRPSPKTVALMLASAFFLSAKPMVERATAQSNVLAAAQKPNPDYFGQAQKPNPDYFISVSLTEFKLRFFQNGRCIDSGKIACGKRESPIKEVSCSLMDLRPPFNPTESEKPRFKPAPPERSLAPAVPKNPLGRVRFIIENAFRMHGTCWPSSLGHAASNGCIRVANDLVERIRDTLMATLYIARQAGRPGGYQRIEFSKRFGIRLYYRLWEVEQASSSSIRLWLYRDIHHRLNGRRSKKCPLNENVAGNAFTLKHFLDNMAEKGWKLRNGLTENSPQVAQFWNMLGREISKTSKPREIELNHSIFEPALASK